MGLFVVSLSDVGEGVAEAELIEWHVAVGDTVSEDQLLGVVMTDKAAVDIPSSVLGKVMKLCCDVGDVVAVGSDLIHLEVDGDGNTDASTDVVAQSDMAEASQTIAQINNDRFEPIFNRVVPLLRKQKYSQHPLYANVRENSLSIYPLLKVVVLQVVLCTPTLINLPSVVLSLE